MVKDVKGYEGLYLVYDDGRVFGVKRGEFLKPDPRERVRLCKNNNVKRKFVHRIVAEAFISNYKEEWEVHHIDHDTTNNNIDNLMCIEPRMHKLYHSYSKKTRGKKIEASHKREVAAINAETNEVVAIYASRNEASRELNIHVGSVANSIHKGWKAQGYYFKEYYADESLNLKR